MRIYHLFIGLFFIITPVFAHAQTACLSFPSNSSAPANYGVSWDVTSPGKELLVKSNCPTSGNDITITVGRGVPTTQLIWNKSYVYNTAVTPARWDIHTLSGTLDANGWVTNGEGTKTVTTPFTPTATNPLFFVGYVCTYHNSAWKCGCRDLACTSRHWQLQGYKGTGGGGTTGGTTGGGGGNPSGLPWKSGAGPGTNNGAIALDKADGFGAWRGRDVDVQPFFIGQNGWTVSYEAMIGNDVLDPTGGPATVSQHGIMPTLTIPIVTRFDAGKFSMVAGGGVDVHHQAIANKIKTSMGGRRIYLRIGHEADEGYPWSYTGHDGDGQPNPANPAEYKAAWRRIAQIYKDTVPNSKIVWNVLKNTRQKVTDYYPGDDIVDIISIDVYDNGSGGYCNSATSPGWINFCRGDYNPATGVSKGIGGILEFAKSHGKKIAVDEWGATNKTHLATDGANNSFFVQGMYDFFAANAAYIEYESYYNRAGGGDHQVWPREEYNGLVSDAYRAKWSP